MAPERLSRAAARRIAIAAQGFGAPSSTRIDRRHLSRTLAATGLLQIDSVNVLARAHYLPLFSRHGAYPRTLLDTAAWGRPRTLFEYWAHEASLLPMALHPLLRWRMSDAQRGVGIYGGLARFATERRPYIETLYRALAEGGPRAASDFEGERGPGGWWGWSDAKRALEYLFWCGRITTATRRGAFERVYDITERVLPASVLAMPTPSRADAQRALIALAARAHGVATIGDLRDYFRLGPEDGKRAVAELVETGELWPVAVEGWTQPAYLHREARRPRRVAAQALLAPFDPLIWERSRTQRLFDVHYRLEIYTPVAKRAHGYYVLPFLLGDAIVARVDLKVDRAARILRVHGAFREPHAPPEAAPALADALRHMAGWLDLDTIAVAPLGDLSAALRAELPAP